MSVVDEIRLRELLSYGETLTVEFKRDQPQRVFDREVYEVIVCLANSQGGTLLIGVEDDGTVTGAQPRHGATTDPIRLQAAIFNNTEPPINTRVSVHRLVEGDVISIEVDPSRSSKKQPGMIWTHWPLSACGRSSVVCAARVACSTSVIGNWPRRWAWSRPERTI